jgi:hypothetical protein
MLTQFGRTTSKSNISCILFWSCICHVLVLCSCFRSTYSVVTSKVPVFWVVLHWDIRGWALVGSWLFGCIKRLLLSYKVQPARICFFYKMHQEVLLVKSSAFCIYCLRTSIGSTTVWNYLKTEESFPRQGMYLCTRTRWKLWEVTNLEQYWSV